MSFKAHLKRNLANILSENFVSWAYFHLKRFQSPAIFLIEDWSILYVERLSYTVFALWISDSTQFKIAIQKYISKNSQFYRIQSLNFKPSAVKNRIFFLGSTKLNAILISSSNFKLSWIHGHFYTLCLW